MGYLTTPPRDRAATIAIVALLHALLGYALIAGLKVTMPVHADRTLALFDLLPAPPPPPPDVKPKPREARRDGASSAPNLRAKATEIVAPIVLVPVPPPIVVAPIRGVGADPSAGAAPVAGPGTGGGGDGDGDGDGDGGGTLLRWKSGRLKDSDYPRAALAAGVSGTVHMRFTVGVKGRVTDCTVTRSSGNAELDETTCRLIRERLRYAPSRDAAGKPIPEIVTGEHRWTAYGRPPDAEDDAP